jgi:hypothetical protein
MIYDNLTDDELIREADGHSGLIKALSERLEMRQRMYRDLLEEERDPTKPLTPAQQEMF